MRKVSRVVGYLVIASLSVLPKAGSGSPREGRSGEAGGEVRQWEITGPWGGDVRSLVCSPNNADLLYLGTSDGQLYRSTDGAQTWRRLKPGLGRPGLSIDYIVIDPRNTRTIYAGTWAVSHKEAGGVFKSEDGGEEWELLEDTRGLSVRSLAIAPSDSNVLIAGTANDDQKLNGVFRSRDAGKTWQRISPEGDREIRNIESVAIDPKETDVIFIGTWHLPWKSTDGGQSWKQTGYKAVGMIDDSDIFGICIDPSDPSLVYMNACSGIYRSRSGGNKWQKIEGIPFSARRSYALLPHPSDPDMLFVGTSEGLYRVKGKSLKLLTSKNVVVRAVVIHPDKPNRVLIASDDFGVQVSNNLGDDDFVMANDGFIHRHILAIMPDIGERRRLLASVFHDGSAGSVFLSTDGGESWRSSSRGLGTRDVHAFLQRADNPEVIYAGTNIGVYRSNDRGESWSFVGLPKEVKKPGVKRRPIRRRASVGRYVSSVAAQRRGRKAPPKKGRSTARKGTVVKPVEPAGPVLVELTAQVDDITPFVDDQGRRGLFAATMSGLYRTFDETKGWEKVLIGDYPPNGRVFAVSSHKGKPEVIYAGTQRGLFISHDAGLTWGHFERGPNDASVKAIAQDPADPDFIILGTSQFVYRTTNGGRSWVVRGGGVPVGDFTSVCINPQNPKEILVADYSHGGIYRSRDRGYTWERIDTELPSNRVWTMTFDPFDRERVYAGSFSSGVYVLTIQRGAAVR